MLTTSLFCEPILSASNVKVVRVPVHAASNNLHMAARAWVPFTAIHSNSLVMVTTIGECISRAQGHHQLSHNTDPRSKKNPTAPTQLPPHYPHTPTDTQPRIPKKIAPTSHT